jgi:hypothetical protein
MTCEEVRAAEVDLVKLIEGTVIRVGDPGYDATLNIDNGRISHRPYLVAIASTARDVASIVRYCSEHDLRLTTKAGGHSAAGYCLNSDGIVLDLSNLNSIQSTAHGSRLTVGTGSRWINVYDYLQQQKSEYMVVGGGCGTVGLGGYLLAGGYQRLCDEKQAPDYPAKAENEVGKWHRKPQHQLCSRGRGMGEQKRRGQFHQADRGILRC